MKKKKAFAIPPLQKNDPIFKQGFVVGLTMGGRPPPRRSPLKPVSVRSIFCMMWAVKTPPRSQAAIARVLTHLGAVVYLFYGTMVFFGFPNIAAGEAAKRAVSARMKIARLVVGGYLRLSASTQAHARWRHLVEAPWDFVGTPELEEALTVGVQFNSVE